jgi:hypothetical protein
MSDDALDFYLPNVHNCIESAKYQLVTGNHALALDFLNAAQKSLAKVTKRDERHACNRP